MMADQVPPCLDGIDLELWAANPPGADGDELIQLVSMMILDALWITHTAFVVMKQPLLFVMIRNSLRKMTSKLRNGASSDNQD